MRTLTPEHKQKLSKAKLGNKNRLGTKHSLESKARMRESALGRTLSEEAKQKLSVANRGKILSEETKRRIRDSKRNISAETRAKLSVALTGKRHSEATKRKISEIQIGKYVGEKSPHWKGGITPVVLRLRHCHRYRAWVKTVFERDDYTCVSCSVRGGRLNADHITPFSCFISELTALFGVEELYDRAIAHEDLWDISNGRTLCVPCHKKTDTFGRKASNYRRHRSNFNK